MVNESLIKAEPAEQNYSAAPIHVAEHISTSDSVTNNISAQNKLLNSVNNLTRGGKRRMKKGGRTKSKNMRKYYHRYNTRTNKRRLQHGGEPIIIAQSPGHATCSEGTSCPGAQNAVFTSISNQLESNGKNDRLMGGRRKMKKLNKYSKRRYSRNNKNSVRKNRK